MKGICLAFVLIAGYTSSIIPTILVPGIGGSILYASNTKLCKYRVWLCYTQQDKYALEYLDSYYENGTTYSRNGYNIDTNYTGWIDGNLDQIDTLDSDLWFESSKTYYMHFIIKSLKDEGYVPGKTLFGMPYDWRQHVCHPTLMNQFWETVNMAIMKSNTSKVNIVSHSMGGLVIQCAMQLYPKRWSLIRRWITIATPFRGTGGYSIKSYMNGYDMGIGHGWMGGFSERVSSQIMLNFASVPNLLPYMKAPSNMTLPSIHFYQNGVGNITLRGQALVDGLSQMTNLTKKFLLLGQTWRNELPSIIPPFETVVIYGSSFATPHDITVTTNVSNLSELRSITDRDLKYGNVPGDGTVPTGSASSPFFSNATLLEYKGCGDHTNMLKDDKLIQMLTTLLSSR